MQVRLRCDPALETVLPRPRLGRQAVPDWLRAMPMAAASEMHGGGTIRTAKQCPPFVDAMRSGFVMPLPCDVRYADGRFDWDWPIPEPSLPGHPRAPLSFFAAAQIAGAPFGAGNIVKFVGCWTIELPPGWSLLATHPFNRDDLPFRTLTGIVDADTYNQIGLLFPARWLDPARPCTVPRGTPVAQCIPVPREPLDLSFQTIEDARAQDFSEVGAAILARPGVYRERYRARVR